MTSSRHAHYDFKPTYELSIRTVDDSSMEVLGVGLLDFLAPSQDDSFELTLDTVLLV